tara:strand:- start:19949 stop:20206 length:258 start_codon:yes stop_codon:yes gene_type:complete
MRSIEIFSAGCPTCKDVIALVNKIACSSCEIAISDMQHQETAKRAKELGINKIPAVLVDGVLADCCASQPVDEDSLRKTGIGKPL